MTIISQRLRRCPLAFALLQCFLATPCALARLGVGRSGEEKSRSGANEEKYGGKREHDAGLEEKSANKRFRTEDSCESSTDGTKAAEVASEEVVDALLFLSSEKAAAPRAGEN
jgi:hypothetical protein